MTEYKESLDALKDIRNIMDRSSRFISLSGWSGVAAGCCALIGAWFANGVISQGTLSHNSLRKHYDGSENTETIPLSAYMGDKLLWIAILTFLAALILAFLFTHLRSQKQKLPLWGSSSRRMVMAVGIPMAAGGIYLLKLMQAGAFGFIAPGCLLFYGLALMNASKYTLGEIKWLGMGQVVLGLINLQFIGYGLYFWAFGFGLLHIVYGLVMWWRYERQPLANP